MIVDDSFGAYDQGYRLARTYRLGGHTVRVRIRRDFYEMQSHAVVEVLTPALTWTPLADEPAATWHAGTPSAATSATPLAALAARLRARAAAILGA